MGENQTLDLESTEVVFSNTSNAELLRAYWLFRIMEKSPLISIGKAGIKAALALHLPVEWLLKETLFRQFCGGTSLETTVPVVDALSSSGIHSILDFSVEGGKTEEARDRTADEIVRGIEYGAQLKPKVSMFAVKLTGLFSFDVLERKQREVTGGFRMRAFENGLKRIEQIAQSAARNGLPISIDAEQTWIQDTIDDICLDLMRRYNAAKPVIGTTLQFYRRDRLSFLQTLVETARRENFVLAFKAVRGAYMESERERAETLDYADPIYPNKESTDNAFNSAIEISLKNLDVISFWIATHNEYSCEYAVKLLNGKDLPQSDRAGFAQLKGMSDNISYNLSHAGYYVAKYLPYGPVRDVVPYLFRRADENRAVSVKQPARELDFIRSEMERRRLSAG